MTESYPKIRRLGYARVSTYGQTLDAQLTQLRAEGCVRIYREKASGAQPTRRELPRMLKALAPGNVVTVTRIDRLARSTFDLFAIIKQIVDAGGQFRSLAEPWADTATSAVRIEEIADFVLAIENYEQAGSKLHFLQSWCVALAVDIRYILGETRITERQ